MPVIAKHNRLSPQKVALTTAGVGVVSAAMFPLYGTWDLANIVMIYMLLVLVVAVKLGRSAGFWPPSVACCYSTFCSLHLGFRSGWRVHIIW